MKNGYVITSIILAGMAVGINGCAKENKAPVSYAKQIRPIIDSRCIECHATGGQGFEASGLNMETYEGLLKGTKFGPVIKPSDALSSTLMILIDGRADPSINMPHGDREPLTGEQIKLFEEWINQGALNN